MQAKQDDDFADWCEEAIEDISAALEELAEEETPD